MRSVFFFLFLLFLPLSLCYSGDRVGKGFDIHQNSLAHRAVLNYDAARLREILEDPSTSSLKTSINRAGEYPLHIAARIGAVACVGTLLDFLTEEEAFAPSRQTTQKGRPAREQNTAVHVAASLNNEQTVELFLQKYPLRTLESVNFHRNTILHVAARDGSFHTVATILKFTQRQEGFDTTTFINTGNKKRLTALHLASREGHPKIAGILLAQGADPTAASMAGKTPLDLAQQNLRKIRGKQEHLANEYRAVIRLLKRALKEGADEEATEDEGGPEEAGADVKVMAEGKSVRIAAELAGDEGDDTESAAPETEGPARQTTPLHSAAQDGKGGQVTTLLERADGAAMVVTQDAEGNTPLHLAAREHNPIITKNLVEKLGSIGREDILTLPNDRGKTPLQLARENSAKAVKRGPERRANTIEHLSR